MAPTRRPRIAANHGATPFTNDHLDSGYHGSMATSRLVAVTVGGGLVVWHTREEWDTLMRGVDREAVDAMSADVDEFVVRDQRR
jgi:hypothetical protein